MRTITAEYLISLWRDYKNREALAKQYADIAPNEVVAKSYSEQEIKFRGMKEAVEGIIMDMTGNFPKD